MLKAFLAASFTYLSRHILNNPITADQLKQNANGTGVDSDTDREELKVALVAAQESAAVQILLETCLMTENEQVWILFYFFLRHSSIVLISCFMSRRPCLFQNSATSLSNLREVQCLVCSHLHQIFIGEPSLTKLVHFQVSVPKYATYLKPEQIENLHDRIIGYARTVNNQRWVGF